MTYRADETIEQRERRLSGKRASYQRHRDKILQKTRERQAANKEQIAERMRAWRASNFERVTARERAYTQANRDLIRARREAKPLLRAFTHARDRAKQNGLEFTITRTDVDNRARSGCCELTGISFVSKIGSTKDRAFYAPSVDRIDSTRGYTTDNIRIVLAGLNIMMNRWGAEKILEMADALRTHAMRSN
jgi:hypothetical protein